MKEANKEIVVNHKAAELYSIVLDVEKYPDYIPWCTKIEVLVNLAPAKFRGEQSNGMLLAAEGEGIVSLLEPDKDIEDGSEVH